MRKMGKLLFFQSKIREQPILHLSFANMLDDPAIGKGGVGRQTRWPSCAIPDHL